MTDLRVLRTIKEWPKDDQPLEKLLTDGPSRLSDAELIALLLRTGEPANGRNALDIARVLLTQFGGVHQLVGRAIRELCTIPGIGERKAAELLAALELGTRANTPAVERIAFGSSTEVADYFLPRMRDLKKEVFKVLLLDARNKLIRDVMVSEGTLTASIVHPREVFRAAIIEAAAAIICIHNHPSGDPTPSPDDVKITTQLVEAGRLIDIRVLDHIIVGHRTFTSLAAQGLI